MDMQPLIACGLYLGLIMLLGYVVLCIVLGRGTRHWAELVGLCFAAGAGVIEMLLFVISLVGQRPSRILLFCFAIACIFALVILKRQNRLLQPTVPGPRKKLDGMSLLGGLAAVTVIAAAYNVQAHASWPGLGDIDAFAIWMFKAKWVSLSALRPMPPVFWEPGLSYSHQDYPLGFPFLIAGLYAAAGRMDDGLARTLLLPQYLALVAVVYAAMRRMHRRAMAVTITAIFTAAPALVQNAGLAVAETPLLLMYAAALAMMLRWMEGGSSGELMLAAIFVAAAAFTKNEGLALMPVIGVLAFVFAISSRQKIVQWAKACGISIALIVPWLVYRMYLPRTHEDYGGKLRNAAMVIGNLPRLQQVLPGFLGHMFDASYAGLIWSVLIVVTVIGWRGLRRRAVRVLWVLLLMQLSMYVATFVVTPWKVDVLLNMISAKLLVQASPVAVLLIGLLMRRSDAVEATPVPR